MAIRMRRGLESELDISKAVPGEWLISTDTRYIRMCFAPGIVLRVATYEGFESDMKDIEKILSECQTIKEAVERVQGEVNEDVVLFSEYANFSKSYAVGGTETRPNENTDNAKYYYEQTKNISPTGFAEDIALNKQTLGYSKKNLLKNTAVSSTSNGITFTVNDDDGSVTVNGKATAQARLYFKNNLVFDEDTILSIKGTTNGGVSGWYSGGNVFGSEKTVPAGTSYGEFFIFVNAGVTVNNVTVYPMIRSADITDATYEPYVEDVATQLSAVKKSVLNTLEEVEANTDIGMIAGATAVKELQTHTDIKLVNKLDTVFETESVGVSMSGVTGVQGSVTVKVTNVSNGLALAHISISENFSANPSVSSGNIKVNFSPYNPETLEHLELQGASLLCINNSTSDAVSNVEVNADNGELNIKYSVSTKYSVTVDVLCLLFTGTE